jgi:glycosyltransferase involved in cell wall biosynthesis
VLAQVQVQLQVIVVNDGSSDDTADYLEALQDPRVEHLHLSPPRKTPGARNAGLEQCRHRWVAFLDDDDVWGPRRLVSQLDALAVSGDVWAVSDAVLIDEQMNVVGVHEVVPDVDMSRELLSRNIVPGGGSGVLADTSVVRELGGFDTTKVTGCEDWDLWIRLARVSPLTTVPRADVGYLLHTGSMSRRIADMESARASVLTKYQRERAEAGVVADDEWWDGYVLGLHLSSGRRLPAARRRLSMVKSPRPRDLAGVLAVLAAPKAVERRHHARLLDAYGRGRIAEAENWLAELKGGTRPQDG